MKTETSNYREDFPHYSGHIPYKKNEVIGMTVGATNDYIQQILTKEPKTEEVIVPTAYDDYSYYNKDYFNDTFSKEYKLDEEEVFSNQSKNADTWIGSSKYKIYPQHIPGYKGKVPGIYSGNIMGMGYSLSTAKAIKGDYSKGIDCPPKEKFMSCNTLYYKKPQRRTEKEENFVVEELLKKQEANKETFKHDMKKIFKSKIADVPTPGYTGHSSIFQKQVSYIVKDNTKSNNNNMDNINVPKEQFNHILDSRMSETYRLESIKKNLIDKELPYVSGYKGFRTGVKSGNYHGGNFIESSSLARQEYKDKHHK